MRFFQGLVNKKKEEKREEKDDEQDDTQKVKIANPDNELDPPFRELSEMEAKLNKPNRYLTHLSTDKPIYKAGDKVYVRGVVLHGLTRRPYGATNQNETIAHGLKARMDTRMASFEILSPSGDKVFSTDLKNGNRSVVSAFWVIPEGQAGGDYKARISWKFANFPAAEREFNIRAFRAPRVKSQIKFQKKGYGAGEEAVATLNVKRAEGDVPIGAKVTATVRVDGAEVSSHELTVEREDGDVTIRFKLPEEITTGEGTLSCVIQDGGSVENASQTIPILLQNMDVRVYPEGGELISDVENRFYVEAFTKSGDPADIEASIVESKSGEEVGKVVTTHEGRGRSTFVPKSGKEYHLKVYKPSGILNTIPLPKSQSKGVAISVSSDVFNHSEDISVHLLSNKDHKYTVTLFKANLPLDSAEANLKSSEKKEVSLKSHGLSGVLRITVFDDAKPVAERIVFKHQEDTLKIELKQENEGICPGSKLKVSVKTLNSKGEPVAAYLGVTVTDDSVLEMVEKRKQVPRLPEMALLENEVDHLHDCPFYFNPEEKDANLAIDLLLGTQGWRRFLFVKEKSEELEKLPEGKRQRLTVKKPEDPLPKPVVVEAERMKRKKNMMMPPPIILENALRRERQVAMKEKVEARHEMNIEEEVQELKMEEEEEQKIQAPMRNMAEADGIPEMAMAEAAMPMERHKRDVVEDRKIAVPRAAKAMAMPMGAMKKEANFARLAKPKPVVAPFQVVVREFAFAPRAGRVAGERTQFTETLFWNACLRTSEEGKAEFSFGLNDSVTSFKVSADGFTSNGTLGSSSLLIESREPFYMEPKLPLEVTEGDLISVPISMVNNLPEDFEGDLKIELEGKGLKFVDPSQADSPLSLGSLKRERKTVKFEVLSDRDATKVTIRGGNSQLKDNVTRSLSVVPKGFPFQKFGSGLATPNSKFVHKFVVPDSLTPGSLQTEIKLYCTPAGSLTESIKSLNRKPSGCFEQTSTTSYPLVMALQYLESHEGSDPVLVESCRANLVSGYDRLKGYECKSGGFEWFGGDPGHEALTAYGIMQFIEMSKVITVDQDMIKRTIKWLESRKDSKGGFKRNSRALDSFGGAPEEHTNAYITWALTEAGQDTTKEIDNVIQNSANKKQDAYIWALTAICLYKSNRKEEAQSWARKIAELTKEDGSVRDEETSITRSGGESLVVEATALSVLAWLYDEENFHQLSTNAMGFLTKSCKGGNFGSTQATLLALKAIVEFDKKRTAPSGEGVFVIHLNGKEEARIVLNPKSVGTLEARNLGDLFVKGENIVELEMFEGCKLPYSVAVDFFALDGGQSSECQVQLQTQLMDEVVKEGKSTEIKVTLQSLSKDSLPMTLAIVGVPGGLEPRIDKLKELVKAEVIDFYEILGRSVALYWRYLKPNEKKEFLLDVVAAVPGTYTGPASSAYLYYTDEFVNWNAGLKVNIVE